MTIPYIHTQAHLMVLSICHKAILPKQMHSTAYIIIMQLNIIHALARLAVPNVWS